MSLALQRSFDDMGSALVDTTFVVFDLETTGGGPDARITEIGAVKVRAGEVLGEFQTLVDPEVPIPTPITMLTGITDDMVRAAPAIQAVLPSFLEFVGDAALVAHNSSFDVRFLRSDAASLGYAAPGNPVVCTVRLARRLVRDEVPNLQLATLARVLRARTLPSHRALDDARATTDVFHALLELAGRWGITHLDDLLWFQSARGHPSYRKAGLSEQLPRARGVYLFRDGNGRVLYVGKATDLRSRVRSYFGDDRKRIGELLHAMESVDHLRCATDLDASVLEARLIRKHAPPYNRAQRGRGRGWFLKLSDERFPRLVRSNDGAFGPMPARAAEAVRAALEDATAIRTCTQRIGPATRFPACVRGQIGRCPAPCEGGISPEVYTPTTRSVGRALGGDPSEVIEVLAARMDELADEDRFEEAADVRARIAALVEPTRSFRETRALLDAGTLQVRIGNHTVLLREGLLTHIDGKPLPVDPDGHADEPRLIAGWIARNTRRISIVATNRGYALPVAGGRALAAWRDRLRRADPGRERSSRGENPPRVSTQAASPSGPSRAPDPDRARRIDRRARRSA